jgi:hypothetical protein
MGFIRRKTWPEGSANTGISSVTRELKNKHPGVSQGVRRFGKPWTAEADEHLQKPHTAGSPP